MVPRRVLASDLEHNKHTDRTERHVNTRIILYYLLSYWDLVDQHFTSLYVILAETESSAIGYQGERDTIVLLFTFIRYINRRLPQVVRLKNHVKRQEFLLHTDALSSLSMRHFVRVFATNDIWWKRARSTLSQFCSARLCLREKVEFFWTFRPTWTEEKLLVRLVMSLLWEKICNRIWVVCKENITT